MDSPLLLFILIFCVLALLAVLIFTAFRGAKSPGPSPAAVQPRKEINVNATALALTIATFALIIAAILAWRYARRR